jgi:two-component system, OmpR family, response regulator
MSVHTSFHVLCVDDNRDIADSTALVLRSSGFDARACYDARSALKAAAEFRPNVCLIDLNMPGMAGDELAVQLRGQPDWCPALMVAMTAMNEEGYRKRTTAAGFHVHLVKPVDPQQLVALVQRAQARAG